MNMGYHEFLECSLHLAERHRDWCPKLPLAWNPSDPDSVISAVQAFMEYVDENMFPVYTIVDEIEQAYGVLDEIPIRVQGVDILNDAGSFNHPNLMRLLVILMFLYNEYHSGEMDRELYAEMRDLWGIEEAASLERLRKWLQETSLADAKSLPDGFVDLLDYITCNTGHNWLDYTQEVLDYSGQLPLWKEAGYLADEWQAASVVWDRLTCFLGWANSSRRCLDAVISVMRTAFTEIRAIEPDKHTLDFEHEHT